MDSRHSSHNHASSRGWHDAIVRIAFQNILVKTQVTKGASDDLSCQLQHTVADDVETLNLQFRWSNSMVVDVQIEQL